MPQRAEAADNLAAAAIGILGSTVRLSRVPGPHRAQPSRECGAMCRPLDRNEAKATHRMLSGGKWCASSHGKCRRLVRPGDPTESVRPGRPRGGQASRRGKRGGGESAAKIQPASPSGHDIFPLLVVAPKCLLTTTLDLTEFDAAAQRPMLTILVPLASALCIPQPHHIHTAMSSMLIYLIHGSKAG